VFKTSLQEARLGRDFHEISFGICNQGFVVPISRSSWSADNLNARFFHFLDQTIHRLARTDRNGNVRMVWGLLGRNHQFKAGAPTKRQETGSKVALCTRILGSRGGMKPALVKTTGAIKIGNPGGNMFDACPLIATTQAATALRAAKPDR
jgi:hypothetical protein